MNKNVNFSKRSVAFVLGFFIGYLVIHSLIVYWRNNHYNAQFEHNFTSTCLTVGTKPFCTCYYNQVKNTYTYKQAVELDTRASNGDYDQGLVTIVQECAKTTGVI